MREPDKGRLLCHGRKRLKHGTRWRPVDFLDGVVTMQGCCNPSDMPLTHVPPHVCVALIHHRRLNEGAHDLAVLTIVSEVAAVRGDDGLIRVRPKGRGAVRTTGRIQLVVDVVDDGKEHIVLVVEVSIKRPHRQTRPFGKVAHAHGDVSRFAKHLSSRVEDAGKRGLSLGRRWRR